MYFFKRQTGEALVIATPNGEIVIQVLAGDELGVEVPPGSRVLRQLQSASQAGWLPARPNKKQVRAR